MVSTLHIHKKGKKCKIVCEHELTVEPIVYNPSVLLENTSSPGNPVKSAIQRLQQREDLKIDKKKLRFNL